MIRKIFLNIAICLFTILPALAIEETHHYQIMDDFNNSMKKLQGSNVNVAYDEFAQIVNESGNNDYINIVLAGKLSDIGLYNLAQKAASKINDKELARIPMENVKEIFYQKNKIDLDDEIYLAECYSNIMYNDQSKETAEELTADSELRARYDYANFLTALAWHKSNNLNAAYKYIEIAVLQNPKNLQYKYLQAKIFADMGNKEKAVKIIESIKKNMIFTNFYDLKVKELEQYVSYKSAKTEKMQNYHLAYYYYYRGDYLRALKVMPAATDKNKKENSMIYALISQCYVALNEYEKALDNALKAYKFNRNNPDTLMVLGDLRYFKEDYKGALKFYKEAMSKEKTSYNASIKTAKAYLQLDKLPQAQEILLKILKTSSQYYEAYYIIALIEPYKELAYLKKSLGLNSEFTDGWLALANYEMNRDNLNLAQVYLNNAYNLDPNSYKYYYYQGLLYRSQKDTKNAQYCFQKSNKINPKFINVQKELKND